MNWLVLLWTLFVCIVYIGGYLFPASIGLYTSKLSVAYAVVLIAAICAAALRWSAARNTAAASEPARADVLAVSSDLPRRNVRRGRNNRQ